MFYSLQDLCIHELIKQIDYLTELRVLKRLPHNIRIVLLDRTSRRGILTEKMLTQLITPRLRELDLSECLLSDDSYIACLAECNNLRELHMNNNTRSSLLPPAEQNITTSAFLALIPHWSNLTEIQLRACQFVDDQVLHCIAANCLHVKVINVSSCTLVTNDGLIALCVCSGLFCLNISKIPGITDEGLIALSQSSSYRIISELNLCHCTQITDVGIKELLSRCTKLKILVIHGCPKVTERSRQLSQLAQAGENLRLKQVTWTVYFDTPNLQI
ncbi:Protein AMN1-like [Oopsacas minuta]|uniref:Protein AMN1-like n=1 Tax=Oopsacas minuta TaxID=111878 RepID=A0AAV7KFD6_9METZ|nr:Protein AMN1-like [Oopsacas minuta]